MQDHKPGPWWGDPQVNRGVDDVVQPHASSCATIQPNSRDTRLSSYTTKSQRFEAVVFPSHAPVGIPAQHCDLNSCLVYAHDEIV
jgi:hypothetical protein